MHGRCVQAGGSSKADEPFPEDVSTGDLGEGNEAEDEGAGERTRSKRSREGVQPSTKALAQHRRQRLRELQAEQELLASLGSSTGELTYPVIHPAADLTAFMEGA